MKMFKWFKDFFESKLKPDSRFKKEELNIDITDEEWQELLEKARKADAAKYEYMQYLKKNDPKKYKEIKTLEKFTMGL